jgi:hypothetical protein
MRARARSVLFLVPSLLCLVNVLNGQNTQHRIVMIPPAPVDKTNVDAIYPIDWLRYISYKYHLIARDTTPVHLKKMNSPFRELAVLVRDQRITEQEMVQYKMFKRFPLIQNIKMDSLGRVACDVFFRPSNPAADSAIINMLRGYGSQLLNIIGPVAGGSFMVRGYFPLCHLEDITKYHEVILIDKTPVVMHQ